MTTTFKTHRDGNHSKAYRNACRELEAAGYRVSAGSWESDETYCVSSYETHGYGTYNSPKMVLTGSVQ